MATPELETLTPRKASRIRVRAEEEMTKKSKKSKKTNVASSPVNNPIWGDEDEVFVLKKLVDFRVKSGNGSETDWDAFYGFIGTTSMAGKYSKKQFFRKIKELRKKYVEHCGNLERDNDPNVTKYTESETFGYSVMLWGQISEPERLKEQEQPVNESGVAKSMEKESLLEAQQRNKDNELLKAHNEAANMMENETIGNENQEDCDDLATLQDAFETLISSGVSHHQKKKQLEKLMSLGSAIKRELISEWKAICVEKLDLRIEKFLFSATLAEAAEGVTDF